MSRKEEGLDSNFANESVMEVCMTWMRCLSVVVRCGMLWDWKLCVEMVSVGMIKVLKFCDVFLLRCMFKILSNRFSKKAWSWIRFCSCAARFERWSSATKLETLFDIAGQLVGCDVGTVLPAMSESYQAPCSVKRIFLLPRMGGIVRRELKSRGVTSVCCIADMFSN